MQQQQGIAQPGSRTVLTAWGPVAGWLLLLLIGSSEWLSSAHTRGVLDRVISLVVVIIDEHRLELVNATLRKIGHFVYYAMLAVLLLRAAGATITRRLMGIAALAMVVTLMAAAADEWHQTLLPSRTGTARDVLLDAGGAIVAITLWFILRSRARNGVRAPDRGEQPARSVADMHGS